jgi:hypothetical protein
MLGHWLAMVIGGHILYVNRTLILNQFRDRGSARHPPHHRLVAGTNSGSVRPARGCCSLVSCTWPTDRSNTRASIRISRTMQPDGARSSACPDGRQGNQARRGPWGCAGQPSCSILHEVTAQITARQAMTHRVQASSRGR